jgi:hypothetical protein
MQEEEKKTKKVENVQKSSCRKIGLKNYIGN